MIFEQLRRQGITLVFCKITEHTDAMMTQLRREVIPFGTGLLLEYNIGGDMTDFLATTIRTTTSRTTGDLRSGEEKRYALTPATWDVEPTRWWGTKETCRILTFKCYSDGELHPLIDLLMDGPDVKTRDAKVWITRSPVARGERRLAYYCKIKEGAGLGTKDGVAKESRYEGTHLNSKQALIDQAHIQTVAQFLAREFTSKLSKLRIRSRVEYVSVELLQVPGRPHDKQYFSLEPFIKGTYLKFNNNNGYVNKIHEAAHAILQTFSHFTYCYSRGLVMVTDVQGAVQGDTYLLTDPAIHTPNPDKDLPDRTNLGPKGIAAFFATHACNEFCRRLSLKLSADLNIRAPLEIIEEEAH
jgi:hypothetical protein